MRAECEFDWLRVLKRDEEKSIFFDIVIGCLYLDSNKKIPIPDIEITFKSSYSLYQLQNLLKSVDDCRAMLESLCYEDQYDGDNYYSGWPNYEKKKYSYYQNYCKYNPGHCDGDDNIDDDIDDDDNNDNYYKNDENKDNSSDCNDRDIKNDTIVEDEK
jgi:hypothetical protein